jgi:hypothetical protein
MPFDPYPAISLRASLIAQSTGIDENKSENGFHFSRSSRNWAVRLFLVVIFLGLGAVSLRAQEVTLPPIVVTGTFELRQGPSVTDLFTQHLQRQIEAKRVLEEVAASSPIFNARFWRYLPPLQNCSSDSSQFFTPSYLTPDYRNAERALLESRKQSLFNAR